MNHPKNFQAEAKIIFMGDQYDIELNRAEVLTAQQKAELINQSRQEAERIIRS